MQKKGLLTRNKLFSHITKLDGLVRNTLTLPLREAASIYFWSVSLVYQLSGQFLIFLVDQKNILVDQNEI